MSEDGAAGAREAPRRNPDGSVRDQSLVEIKRDMLLQEAAEDKRKRRKREKKRKKKAKKKRKHKHKRRKRKKHKKKGSRRSDSSGSSSDSSSDSSSSSSDSDSGSDEEGDGEAAEGASAPVRYSELMRGSARTADGSDARVEVRYSSVSGKVISMDRKQSEQDKQEDEERRARLMMMNGGEDDEVAERNTRRKRKKSKSGKKGKHKGQMEKVAETLVENGKRAREELSGGDYKKRLKGYQKASNEGLTVDFAQMQKDRRYYGRLKAAERASKAAQRYQSAEGAKMDALKEMFGLDRLDGERPSPGRLHTAPRLRGCRRAAVAPPGSRAALPTRLPSQPPVSRG